jgi:hypothetical protein
MQSSAFSAGCAFFMRDMELVFHQKREQITRDRLCQEPEHCARVELGSSAGEIAPSRVLWDCVFLGFVSAFNLGWVRGCQGWLLRHCE